MVQSTVSLYESGISSNSLCADVASPQAAYMCVMTLPTKSCGRASRPAVMAAAWRFCPTARDESRAHDLIKARQWRAREEGVVETIGHLISFTGKLNVLLQNSKIIEFLNLFLFSDFELFHLYWCQNRGRSKY